MRSPAPVWIATLALLGIAWLRAAPAEADISTEAQARSRADLERFVAEKTARSRIDAAARREIVPRAAERNSLRRDMTPAERSAYVERLRRDDQAAMGRLRVDLHQLELQAGRPLGPATLRVLEANRVRARVAREQDLEALTQEVERPEPPQPERHFLGD